MVKTSYKKGDIYGVEAGDFIGQMFVIVKITDSYVGCLRLPDMDNIRVPKDSFDLGRNMDIIKRIEKLPRKVYKISEAQYIKNEDSNNRWKQSDPSNILDSKKPS